MADDALDAALIQFKQEQDDRTTLGATASLHQAITQNPDEMARYNSIARKTGLDPLLIATDPQVKVEAERRAKMQDLDLPGLVQSHPKTASALTDANLAALVHDDTDGMKFLEDSWDYLTKGAGAVASSVPQAASGIWGTMQGASDIFLAPYLREFADLTGTKDAGKMFRTQAEESRKRLGVSTKALMPKADGVIEAGVYSGLQSIGTSLMTLPMGLAGAPSASLGTMAAITGGEAYGQAADKGVAPAQAAIFALSQGAIEYATEKIPMGVLLKDLKVGTPFYKTLANQIAREIPGEQLATITQDLNEWAVLHPEKPFSEYIAERPSAAVQTLVATMVGTGGTVATLKGLELFASDRARNDNQMRRAESSHEALTQLSQAATAAKLRERDPAQFKAFMQSMVEDSDLKEVFVDGAVLQNALAQAPIEVQEKFAKDMPEVVRQVGEAEGTDGFVRVPVEDYATHIAGTELDATILPNLKTEVEGLTYAQAQEQVKGQTEQMKAEAEQLLVEKEKDTEFQADAKQVYDTLYSRIEGAKRFTSDANKKYAALQQAYFITRAQKLGIKPSELLAQFDIKVQAERTGGAAELEQQKVDKVIEKFQGLALRETGEDVNVQAASAFADQPFEVTPGVVELSFDDVVLQDSTELNSPEGKKRIAALAEEIKASGEIAPLTVARPVGKPAYVAEGAHRARALRLLGYKTLPAIVATETPPASSDYGFRRRAKARVATLEDFKPENIKNLLRKTNWAILTAENPNKQQLSPEENAQRNTELRADLEAMGVQYAEAEGRYQVVGVTREQALDIGQRYGQDSVETRDGRVFTDFTVQPATKVNAKGEMSLSERRPLTEDRVGELTVEAYHFAVQPLNILQGRIEFHTGESRGKGAFRHELTLDNIYDAEANILGLPSKGFDEAVKAAGFDGYLRGSSGVLLDAAELEVDIPPKPTEYAQALNEIAETLPPVGKLEQQDLADLRKMWTMYAASETAAQYGTARVKAFANDAPGLQRALSDTLDEVMQGMADTSVKNITHWHEGSQRLPTGGFAYEISSGSSSAAIYLDMTSRSMQIDITRWGAGRGGSGIYKALLDFAQANDFVFYGDAQGISMAGIKRRLENLLSHALQSGGTSYMRLHPKQIDFIEQETGLKIEWSDDAKKNIEQMLNASYNLVNIDIPELKNVYFDFTQREFIARDTGAPADIAGLVAKTRRNVDAVRREGAPGLASAKRAVFANTLLSAKGDARRTVFAEMAQLSLEQLPGAERLLYQSEPKGEYPVPEAGGATIPAVSAGEVLRRAKKLKLKETKAHPGLRFVTATLEKVGERELPEKILTMKDAADATAYLSRTAVEHFDAIVTDKDGKTLAVIGSFKGAASSTSVYPSTLVLEMAKIEGAANVWASHNHPSGLAQLSSADERLSETIGDLLRGSGVEYQGLLAIAGKEYVATTGHKGDVSPPANKIVKAPVAERMIEGEANDTFAIASPAQAKVAVLNLAKDEPGILFLSAQNTPVSFAPFAPEKMGELRTEGRLMELFNAAASTGASAAILANPNDAINPQQRNNVINALGKLDINVIDVVSYDTSSAEGVASSLIEEGGYLLAGDTFFQKNRGTFNPDTLTISLLKDADLTTFLHETGHAFLEFEASLASDPRATPEMRADFQKTLDWFGVKDAAEWDALPFEQKRPHHEKFARGFEAYLFEGKAPSNELRSVFASFKSWLLHVYRTIANLNVELTDEVRGVFDRMLASEEAIATAQRRTGMTEAMIDSANEKDKAAYTALDVSAGDASSEELQRRSLRDMKWLSNAKSQALKKLQREAASKRKEIRAEVTTEVNAEPINQARAFLRKGVTTGADGESIQAADGFRLNREIVAEMYPETMLARPDTSKLRGMTEKDGLHPDLVADMFGFRSGDVLIHELIEGENPKDKIAGLTDQRMLERYGDLVDGRAVEEAANEAVHNEARARFMATGLKMLSDSKLPASQIQKAATDAADQAIAAKKVRDLHPAQYIAAEARASKEVLKKAAKDVPAAQRAQRSALLNNRLAKAAQDAQEEVRKGIDRMTRVQKAAAQANMRGEYLAQLNELLSRFDLRKSTTLKEIDAKRTPLAEWLATESERMSAVMPDMPAWILNESNRTSYKDLTVEEFRGVLDAVKQLEMLARREEKQYQEIRGMKFKEERTALLERIRQFHPEAFALDGEPLGMSPKFVKHFKDRVGDIGDKFMGEFLNAETLVNLLEGGEFGIAHESLIGRMSKRADWKATRIGGVYTKMAPLFGQYSAKERYDFARKDIGAPIGMSLTRENALVTALLHGNAEGRERLANYGWSEQKQKDIVNLLDERDMRLAEGIWDLFDNDLWPELKELNDRTRGKSPPKVEALEVQHGGKTYRGGYFRLKYDTNLDERAQRLDEGAAVKELLGGGMGMSAKTGQGASTERKQNVTMRPRLDLGVFAEAVTETVHDIAYREAVADTMRMLNDVRVQNTIKTAAGIPAYRALVTRVREIAAPPRNPSGFIEKTLSVARKNTIVTLMSGVNTALQNFTGFVSAAARVNPGRLAKEIALFYSPKMAERIAFAAERSEYMKNRHSSFERDMQNEVKKLTAGKGLLDYLPDTSAWLVLMSTVDKGTSVPVWLSAYHEGMVKFENDNGKAVDYADHVVRQSQGSGRELDVAQIMAGHGGYGHLKRVFTMFYSYFNAQLGMLVRSGVITAHQAKTNPKMAVARFTKDFMLIVVLPAVLTAMIFKKDDPDEDPEKWLKKYGTAIAMYGMAMVPLVRDIGSFMWASFDHDVKNYGYKMTPIQSMGEGVVKGLVSARDAAAGEGDDRDLKNIIMGTSFAIGLPGKLISDTTMGTKAFLEGEAGPEAVVFGPPRK